MLYFVVSPITATAAYTQCRKSSKKFKRNLSKSYRQYRRYGVYEPLQNELYRSFSGAASDGLPYFNDEEGEAKSASFITD